jgi:hypothetical protein
MKVKFCESWRITNVKELGRHDMNVNEHERLLNITLRKQIKVKEHERLPNITLRHKCK